MKLYIITTAAPPVLDGIGHYTASLVDALQHEDSSLQITVFAPDGLGKYDPINGHPVRTEFRLDDISTFQRLADILRDEKPDWVCLQYQAFGYGKWGRNPILPRVLKEARASVPNLRLATMVHETFVVPLSKSFVTNLKLILFGTWQRQQFRDLVNISDLAFCSTERWIEQYQPWFPNKPIHHLPVGSNMPLVPVDGGKEAAKRRLGIPEGHLVVGIFGTAHSSRMNEVIGVALDAVRRAGRKPFLLYIGPDAAKFGASVPSDIPSLMDGPFPAEEVSQRLQAIDIYLALFVDGVAARRGSFIAALQHGLATIGLIGRNTDSWLRDSEGFVGVIVNKDDRDITEGDASLNERLGEAVYHLAADNTTRHRYESNAMALFEERFAWKKIVRTILQKMADTK